MIEEGASVIPLPKDIDELGNPLKYWSIDETETWKVEMDKVFLKIVMETNNG